MSEQPEKMQEVLAEEHDNIQPEKTEHALNIDALKELTQAVTKLTVEWEKWRKAGRFGLSLVLTSALLCASVIA